MFRWLLSLVLAAFPIAAQAQSIVLSATPIQRFVDNDGDACSGCQLFVYAAGTTNKITTYTVSTGTAQTNPIIMNTRGEPENTMGNSVGIWVATGTAYKMVLAPANDTDPPTNPFWTIDNINTEGNVIGPASSTVGHVPIFNNTTGTLLADPTGTTLSVLLSGSSNFTTSGSEFSGGGSNAAVWSVQGSSGTPNSTQNPVWLAEKFADGTQTSGVNAATVALLFKSSNGSNTRATAAYANVIDTLGWSGVGSGAFSEAMRGDCRLAATASQGACGGGIFTALEALGATHTNMIGVEGELQNTSTDATDANFAVTQITASFDATSRGTKNVHAGFLVNPNTPAGAEFLWGVYCPSGNNNGENPGVPSMTEACIRSDAGVTWALDASRAGLSMGQIALPHNSAIWLSDAGGTGRNSLVLASSDNKLHLGIDAGLAGIVLGSSSVVTSTAGTLLTSAAFVLGASTPTVIAGQVGLGNDTAAAASCGALAGSAGCLKINVAGTDRFIPYY